MGMMTFQITSLTIVYSAVYWGADQRKHQSSSSLAFVRGIHRWPVNSPNKRPVTRIMFPFDDVIMINAKLNLGVFSIFEHKAYLVNYSDVIWTSIHRQPNYLFDSLSKLKTKDRSKLHTAGLLWGESTSDRWIPLIKARFCGKHLHCMLDPPHKGSVLQKAFPLNAIVMPTTGMADVDQTWVRRFMLLGIALR